MSLFLRNTITSLYNTVSTPVAATRDALISRLKSVRDTATLLYNNIKEKLGYRHKHTLKDSVEEEAEKEY